MNKTNLFKAIILLIILAVFMMPTSVYAFGDLSTDTDTSTGTDTDNDLLLEDPADTEEPTDTNTDADQESVYDDEDLPETGRENTTLIIASVVVCGVVAVIAYKKINEYRNI